MNKRRDARRREHKGCGGMGEDARIDRRRNPRHRRHPGRPCVLRARRRAMEAADLRAKGLSFKAIAAALGYNSAQAAHYAVGIVLRAWKPRPKVVEELREMTLRRLERLMPLVFPAAFAGDLAAVGLALRIMDLQLALNGFPVTRAAAKPKGRRPRQRMPGDAISGIARDACSA